MSNDRVSINFPEPLYSNGEMITSGKLNKASDYFRDASDEVLRVLGNIYLNNIPNVAATIGDFSKLANGANLPSPATPAIFTTGSPYLNRIPATLSTVGGFLTAALAGSLKVKHLVGTSIYNIILVALNGSGTVIRAYNCSYAVTNSYISGDITQVRITSADTDSTLQDDITNGNIGGTPITFSILAANESLVDTITQAVANIGSLQYPSNAGIILDTLNTIVTGTNGDSLTAEISRLEDKMFYVYWRIQLLKSTGVFQSAPAETGDAGTNLLAFATWRTESSPNPILAATYIDDHGISFTAYATDLSSDAFALDSTRRAAEIVTPNPLRAGVYYNGIPILKSDGCRVTAYAKTSNKTIYIPQGDLTNVPAGGILTVYVPVAIPYRLIRSLDLANRGMIDMWYNFFLNVVGIQYASGTRPSAIANRLTRLENNQETLRTAILNLTTTTVNPWTPL